MASRAPALQTVLDLAEACIGAAASGAAARAASEVFERLRNGHGEMDAVGARGLPVSDAYLAPCIGALASAGSKVAALGQALAALAPALAWDRRKTSTPANQPFHDGHANATLAGPGGYERREDVWVGATLMAPGILYPDHSHPPEEVYLALSEGEWWNSDMEWTEPGRGGIIYNPPGILHAMRSGQRPFLALWVLPVG